jgi:ferredoxin-NADP reductase
MKYFFLAGGGGVMLLVAAQIVIWIFDEFRRRNFQARQYEISTEVLIQRLAAARQQRIANEDLVHGWNGVRKFAVTRKVDEGGQISSFYLTPHDKKAIPPFKPGQYLTFEVNVPSVNKKVIRCYSLSDSPGKEAYRVSVKKILASSDDPKSKAGLVSSFFHEHIKEGDILDVKAPGGSFYLDEAKPTPIVLIGGGVGITPVLSMLNYIIESGLRVETWFFLGVRNREEHVFKKHLEEIARANERVRIQICYSRPGSKDVKGTDYHHAERVSVDLFKKVLPSNNYEYYMCGPGPMMNSLMTDLREWGVPEKNIHFEAFGAASVKKTAASTTPEPSSAPSARIVFSKSGKEVDWKDNGSSLLELAEANGITLPFGCRAGNCGTCILAVKEGEVSYLKEPGCQVEAGACLTCISKPKGNRIVLDA